MVPIKGSDVAMLEQMLWQLGVSPQMGSPGGMGARIASNRAGVDGGVVNTVNCQNTPANDRSNFYPGYFPDCAGGEVSMEVMLRRFQGRNDTDPDQFVTDAVLQLQSGQLDDRTLIDLKRDWKFYMRAYNELAPLNVVPPAIIDKNDSRMNAWLDVAVSIWDTGAGTHVPAAEYTKDFHASILTAVGLTEKPGVNDRRALLHNWMLKEMPHHWGTNAAKKTNDGGAPYQPTPYRMAEGYSDEHGSLSFSQLLYGKRFGAYPCTVHDELGLNLYHPLYNIESLPCMLLPTRPEQKPVRGGCTGPLSEQ
jgi:hypothetical protein